MRKYDGLTNEELVTSYREGDGRALDELMEKNEGLSSYMALRFLRSRGFNDCFSTGLIEDYRQLCRIAIWKASEKYDLSSGAKFSTYAGRAMWNSMTREFNRDSRYRENVIKTIEEEDPVYEEADEEYGDGYDNGFESRKEQGPEALLPSLRLLLAKLENDGGTKNERMEMLGEENTIRRFGQYYLLFKGLEGTASGQPGDDPEGLHDEAADSEYNDDDPSVSETESGEKYRKVFLDPKRDGYSWEYPVYHEVMGKLLAYAAVDALLGDSLDSGQREFLIFLYGFSDGMPKRLREVAEFFNLRIARARKIENAGLEILAEELKRRKLM